MHIVIEDGKPSVKGLPEGNKILFFGKIETPDEQGYCVVFGPPGCMPDKGHAELGFEGGRVAIGKLNKEMAIHEIRHGHKYFQGGGFAEFAGTKSDPKQIFFRLPDNPKPSLYEGYKLKEIYVAL